jgi:hypothetical protein
MFSVDGVRGSIEDLLATLRGERTANQLFQVEIRVEEITGQMRRLLRPIYRRDKGAESSPPVIPFQDMGIPETKVSSVDDLISRCFDVYRSGDIEAAIVLAGLALIPGTNKRRAANGSALPSLR